MIPVILKGETSKPIQLTLREGYVYSGCVLAVCFRGVVKTFTDLVAGGTVELLYTAEETSKFPLGTGKVALSIRNSAGDICYMPWAKIKVTDCPDEVHDAQITIDPATLNVSDATSKDSLGAVKSKLNAVLAFLRGPSSLAVLALPLYALSDVAPLYSAFEDIPGDEQVVTNVVPYVEAKVTAATNAIPRAVLTAATNYTDQVLGMFAATGAVTRVSDGTNTIDAAGIVYAAATTTTAWNFTSPIAEISIIEPLRYYAEGSSVDSWVVWRGAGWYCFAQYEGAEYTTSFSAFMAGEEDADRLENVSDEIYFTRRVAGKMYPVGKLALTNDIPDMSGYATQRQSTNAAVAVADAKISTNNAAFVSAVLAVPIAGADAGDLAELAEYGGYGTVSAAILALIAGLAAIKKRVTSAETALAQKANTTDLPYRLVEPGKWEFSDGGSYEITGPSEDPAGWFYSISGPGSSYFSQYFNTNADALAALSLTFTDGGSTTFTATRATLPGHLCDRAGNLVVVTGDTTLTLPAANPGYLRDFLVRLTVSASSAITFSAQTGETITWDAMGDPSATFAAGTYLFRFTEVAQGVFHAEDMLALVGLEAALAAINGGVAS